MIHCKADGARPYPVATAVHLPPQSHSGDRTWNARAAWLDTGCKHDDAFDVFARHPDDPPKAPSEAILKR
jgi:hypothetical protein